MALRKDIVGFALCLLLAFCSGCGKPLESKVADEAVARTQVQGEGQEEQRPMIWVRPSERSALLAKIAGNEAVADYYSAFTERVETDLKAWENNPETYFRQLPFRWKGAEKNTIPPFKTYTDFGEASSKEQARLMHQLQTAVDCGVLFFLTEDERYARYAADVLHTFIKAIHQLPLETEFFNAGWVYPKDHLREAREISAQLPIIYDFIQPWLVKDGQVFDVGKSARTGFGMDTAEEVFRTYAELAVTRGGTGTNWPILEAPSLIGNALALSDAKERAHYLNFFLAEDTERQDALPTIDAFYTEHGGSWPESFGYSQHVGAFLTYLFALFSHHDSDTQLAGRYPQILNALPEAYYFTYPGGKETILHGDGHRDYHPMLNGYEVAYHIGQRENRPELIETFGPLINHSVQSGGYQRFKPPGKRDYPPSPYREPTKLLWYEPDVPTQAGEYPLPVTGELPFAGITLQRNLSPSGKAEDGLMGFVGGAGYVHGHATGMSMELFGKGFVLGGKGGRTRYGTDIHENYYRIFASNNTVIVNGATTSDGGWVNLGTDRVRRLAVEPEPGEEPVSENLSFSTSAFHDTIGTGAEAYQERTLGIVRTTDSTGYYVDVFRSRSELEKQYHDYIYRNVADRLYLTDREGDINRKPTPDRYLANAEAEWRRNRAYRHPGWHYFKNVETSANYAYDATAVFVAEKLSSETIEMWAHMPAVANREFTTATSPPMTEGPKDYRSQPAPTLVVRQQGEAWNRPFAVVYEPVTNSQSSVASVQAIWRERRCEGMVVKSNERAGEVTQLILTPSDPEQEIVLESYNVRFKGTYGVVTLSDEGILQSFYLGKGALIRVGEDELRAADGQSLAAFADLSDQKPRISTGAPVYLKRGDEPGRLFRPDD